MTKHRALMLGVLILLFGATARTEQAGARIAGTYANLSFHVDGMGGQNRLMPRLKLNADSTYRWGRESGTYEYRDGKILLSGSYAAWGPGKVDKDYKIRFLFTKNERHYTVTMYRLSGK
jgi:hypothetical protein